MELKTLETKYALHCVCFEFPQLRCGQKLAK